MLFLLLIFHKWLVNLFLFTGQSRFDSDGLKAMLGEMDSYVILNKKVTDSNVA